MLRIVSLLIVLSTTALADPVNGPNSVPLFYSILGDNPKYHDAAFKAQEAFFVQSGVTANYNKLSGYALSNANNQATYAISNYTPFTATEVFFVGGTAYEVCIRKKVSERFKDPLFNSITHTISVGKDSASTGLQIPF